MEGDVEAFEKGLCIEVVDVGLDAVVECFACLGDVVGVCVTALVFVRLGSGGRREGG